MKTKNKPKAYPQAGGEYPLTTCRNPKKRHLFVDFAVVIVTPEILIIFYTPVIGQEKVFHPKSS
jgi:hypothetical protein